MTFKFRFSQSRSLIIVAIYVYDISFIRSEVTIMKFVFRLMELAAAESQNNDQDMEEDDDADYYRQEVGAEPEKGTAINISVR